MECTKTKQSIGLTVDLISTLRLVSCVPLVEKLNKTQMLENGGPSLKDISWQSGKPHPGAPKYILQDILT